MKLLYYPGACSLASHIILHQCNAKFDPVKVNLREGEQRKPEYLKLNPKGKVPALILDDGQVITENAAIMIHLADTHPKANLIPPVGDPARTRVMEWLLWCASGIHPAFSVVFAAARMADGEAAQKSVADKGKENVQRQLDLFNHELTHKPYVLGDRLSIADAYTPVFWHWSKRLGLNGGAAHRACVERLLALPSVLHALETEGVKIEL